MDSPTMLWSKKTKKDYHELLTKFTEIQPLTRKVMTNFLA